MWPTNNVILWYRVLLYLVSINRIRATPRLLRRLQLIVCILYVSHRRSLINHIIPPLLLLLLFHQRRERWARIICSAQRWTSHTCFSIYPPLTAAAVCGLNSSSSRHLESLIPIIRVSTVFPASRIISRVLQQFIRRIYSSSNTLYCCCCTAAVSMYNSGLIINDFLLIAGTLRISRSRVCITPYTFTRATALACWDQPGQFVVFCL